MTAREKAIKLVHEEIIGRRHEHGAERAEVAVDAILSAAREGMVGEEQVRKLYAEHLSSADHVDPDDIDTARDNAIYAAIAKHEKEYHSKTEGQWGNSVIESVANMIAAHRAAEHLPNGGVRRNGGEPTPAVPVEPSNPLHAHLEEASRKVEAMPEWKREVLQKVVGHNSKKVSLSKEQAEAVKLIFARWLANEEQGIPAEFYADIDSLVAPDAEPPCVDEKSCANCGDVRPECNTHMEFPCVLWKPKSAPEPLEDGIGTTLAGESSGEHAMDAEGYVNPELVPVGDGMMTMMRKDSLHEPATWTPKVGELVIDRAGVMYHWGVDCGGTDTSRFRPIVASDWVVDVPGFGKMEAWHNESGNITISFNGVGKSIGKTDFVVFPLAIDWLKTHGVPIKPFGWKEGE